MIFEEVGTDLGIPVAYRRSWVTSFSSLTQLIIDAGLTVERVWEAPGYDPTLNNKYDGSEGEELFDK